MTATAQRQELYCKLIDELIRCPNGQEPEVLSNHPDLLDEGLVRVMMQIASMMAHENNQDGAKFLTFMARQLAKNLGLYPELSTESSAPVEA